MARIGGIQILKFMIIITVPDFFDGGKAGVRAAPEVKHEKDPCKY